MSFIKELTCKYCKKYFKDPISLPCGNSMCNEHLVTGMSKFECFFCQDIHIVTQEGFPLIKNLVELLKSNWYLSDDQKQIKDSLSKLEAINKELIYLNKYKDGYITDYFSSIKKKIANDKETAKLRLDSVFDELTNKVNQLENECKANKKSLDNIEVLIRKNEETLMKLREDFRVPDTSAVTRDLLKIVKHHVKLNESELMTFRKEAMNGKLWTYESKEFELEPSLFGELKFKGSSTVGSVDTVNNNVNSKIIKLSKNFGDCIRTLDMHSDAVRCAKINENTKTLATASFDKTIKIWNLENGECLSTIQQDIVINCLCLSSDPTKFISGSNNGYIKIWNARTLQCSSIFSKENEAITTLCLISDNRIACGVFKKSAIILDSLSLKFLKELRGYAKSAFCLKSLNHKLIVSYYDGSIELWNMTTYEMINVLAKFGERINCLEVSYDERLLYSGLVNGSIKVWNIEKGTCINTINLNDRKVNTLKFISKHLLAVGLANSRDNIIIYDVDKNSIRDILDGHKNSIRHLEVTRNGDLLVSTSSDWTIKLWQI